MENDNNFLIDVAESVETEQFKIDAFAKDFSNIHRSAIVAKKRPHITGDETDLEESHHSPAKKTRIADFTQECFPDDWNTDTSSAIEVFDETDELSIEHFGKIQDYPNRPNCKKFVPHFNEVMPFIIHDPPNLIAILARCVKNERLRHLWNLNTTNAIVTINADGKLLENFCNFGGNKINLLDIIFFTVEGRLVMKSFVNKERNTKFEAMRFYTSERLNVHTIYDKRIQPTLACNNFSVVGNTESIPVLQTDLHKPPSFSHRRINELENVKLYYTFFKIIKLDIDESNGPGPRPIYPTIQHIYPKIQICSCVAGV